MTNPATLLLFHSAPVVRAAIRDILEAQGYVVRATGDLGIAVDMVRESPPDLLVIDTYVADISGHEAAVYLRQKCPGMRVLMVAGVPKDDRLEARMAAAGFQIFPQPFAGGELVAKVKAVLQAERPSL